MERRHHKVWPEGLPHDLPPITFTLDDNLRRAAADLPDKPALVFYGEITTYADLDDQVTRIAGYLQSVACVKKGDRVGLSLQNAPQFVAGYYGIIRAGGVVVPINPMNVTEESQHIIEDAGLDTMLTAQERVETLSPLLASGLLKHIVVATYADALPRPIPAHLPVELAAERGPLPDWFLAWADMLAANHPFAPVALSPEDLCVLPYTSGSTGRGKGCMHSHRTTLHTSTGESNGSDCANPT